MRDISLTWIETFYGQAQTFYGQSGQGRKEERSLKYSEFCEKFYFNRNSTALAHCKSKSKIGEFFFRIVLGEVELNAVLPESDSTYEKYYRGTRNSEELWGFVVEYFDEAVFCDNLIKVLKNDGMTVLTDRFKLELKDEAPDKSLLASAIAKQFYAIAEGGGEADDIINAAYQEARRPKKFPAYIDKATDKYRRIDALTGGSEVRLLKDYYVCNPLTTSKAGSRTEARGVRVIEDATAWKIAEISNRVILIANGGCGKTLMLQHLFVDAALKYASTDILPIIVELREFRFGNRNLLKNIVDAVNAFDESITEGEVTRLLDTGKCLLMFDGADEIDPGDVDEFKRQFSSLLDRNSKVQVIVTSRECEIVDVFEYYGHLYLVPFGRNESLELIGKILDKPQDAEIRKAVITWLDSDFLKEHVRLASNPMLLTTIVKQYPLPDQKQKTFYQNVYDAIIAGHDDKKWGYKRIYHSAASAEEFTEVFREFCAKSYRRCMFEFGSATFENIFRQLKSKTEMTNPNLMKKKAFIHDACVTACMMYEESLNYFYFDKGFQEYLFAEYYYLDEPENVKQLGRSLWNVPVSKFGGDNAFRMLYDFSADKVEVCLFMPFLKEIFDDKNEDAAYEAFLTKGYSKIEISSWNNRLIREYERKQKAVSRFRNVSVNEPVTVILSLILTHLGVEQDFQISLEEKLPDSAAAVVTAVFTGEMAYDAETKEDIISLRRLGQEDVNNWEAYKKTHSVGKPVVDDDGAVVCFGYEYSIDFRAGQMKRLSKYGELISAFYDEKSKAKNSFLRVKRYYEMLVEKHTDEFDGNF